MDISAPNHVTTRKGTLLVQTLLATLAVFVLALLSLALSSKSNHFTPLWFPTAAIIVALYRQPPTRWGLPLLAFWLAIVAASIMLFGYSWLPVKLALINLLEAVVSTLLLRRLLLADDPLNSLTSWLKFVVCAVIFPPCSALCWPPGGHLHPGKHSGTRSAPGLSRRRLACCR